jgi:hypothetical protein
MKFSAQIACRKWSYGLRGVGRAMVGAVVAVLLCAQIAPAEARRSRAWPEELWNDMFQNSRPKRRRAAVVAPVPLPQPRPAEAPALVQKRPANQPQEKVNPADARKPEATAKQTEAGKTDKPAETGKADKPVEAPEADKPTAEKADAALPAPSACRLALTDAIAIAPSIPDIRGPGACGGEDLVRLEAVVLADKSHVAVKPAAILRCSMASALADWVRSDVAPLAAGLGTKIGELDNFDSFECRGRNRVVGARLSEHGKANAIDVRGLKFANGQSLSLTDRAVPRALRETVLASVCARFTTVLGPGSDWYHEDHIHLDLSERRSGYRICQWNVYDPMPAIAPLLPAQRPDDAPPREVAVKAETARPDAPKPDAADAAKSGASSDARAAPGSRKKRRQTGAF